MSGDETPHRRLDLLIPSWLENKDAFAQTEDMNFGAIAIIAASNLAFAACCLLIFEGTRRGGSTAFYPKMSWCPAQTPSLLPTKGFGAWFWPLLAIDDTTVLRCAGVDGLLHLRAMKLGLRVFGKFIIIGFGILIPINLSCSRLDASKYVDLNLFSQCTLSNVPARDAKLWIHLGASYLLAFITMRALARECRIYTKLRHRYLASPDAAHHRTVLVERIPRELRSNARLTAYFSSMYPARVAGVRFVQDLSVLEKLVARRLRVATALERALAQRHYEATGQALPRGARLLSFFFRVDPSSGAVAEQRRALEQLNGQVGQEKLKRVRAMKRRDRPSYGEEERVEAQRYVVDFLRRTRRWSIGGVPEGSGLNSRNVQGCGIHNSSSDHIRSHSSSSSRRQGVGVDDYDRHVGNPSPRKGNGATGRPGGSDFVDDDEESAPFTMPFEDSEEEEDSDDETAESSGVGDTERTEWNRNMCSRLLLVFEYATSATSLLKDVTRVLNANWKNRRKVATSDDFSKDFERRFRVQGGDRGHETSSLLHEKEDGVSQQLPAALTNDGRVMSKAFVTFKTLSAATVARQVTHYAKPGGMSVRGAPEGRDIFWSNLYMAKQESLYRRIIIHGLLAVALVAYVVPVTLINFIASPNALRSLIPWVDLLCRKSYLINTTVHMIQPMLIMGLMALLPPMILGLGYWEGNAAMSWAQLQQTSRYFTFLVLNVLLVSTVAGSVISAVTRLLEEPTVRRDRPRKTSIVLFFFFFIRPFSLCSSDLSYPSFLHQLSFKMLADGLPKVSGFFCCYLLMKGLSGMSMELARVIPLVQHILKRLIYPALTARDRRAEVIGTRDFDCPGWLPFGKLTAEYLLIVVVTMSYACLSPVILLPA